MGSARCAWVVTATLLGAAVCRAEAASCAPAAGADAAMIGTVSAFLNALRDGDEARFTALSEPDFLAFDGGQKFDRDKFIGLVADLAKQGTHFEWNVTAAQARHDCTLGVVSYVNDGAVIEKGKRTASMWLESAVLRFGHGAWRMTFLESTPYTP